MKHLARLILSIEGLVKNPVGWFSKQNWVLRVLIPLLLVPAISAVSIFSYHTAYLRNYETQDNSSSFASASELEELKKILESYHESEIEEIIYLNEEIASLKLAMNLEGIEPSDSEVLGVGDSSVTNEIIKQRLQDNSSESDVGPETKSAYIRNDDPNVVMYQQATTSSPKVTNFKVGTLYPVLSEKNNWVEIDFGDGNSAWIDIKYVIIFPIDENN